MARKKEPPALEGEIVKDKTPKDKPGEKPKTQSQSRSSGPVTERGLVLLILAAALLAGLYYGYPRIKGWVAGTETEDTSAQTADQVMPAPTPMERLAQLEEKMISLETEVQNQASQPGDVSQDLSNIEDRLTALEQKVDALSLSDGTNGGINSDAAGRIQALEKEVDVLREALAQAGAFTSRSSTNFAQALAQLAPPLYQSRSFEGELEQLRVLILALPTLEQATLSDPMAVLSDYAESGIPDMDYIRASFNQAALEALKTEGLTEDAGWWDKTWVRIKGLVVVRRNDETDMSTLEGALSQAEKSLETGKLADALKIINNLPDNAQQAFTNWLALTGEREAALEAYDKLVRFVPRNKNEPS